MEKSLENSIEKEFLPYPEAMELKELGFNEPCFGYHDNEELQFDDFFDKAALGGVYWWNRENKNSLFIDKTNPKISAPTFSQAFRWFRKKGLNHHIETGSEGIQIAYIHISHNIYVGSYSSYEEAELACVRKLIEIVKMKNII